MKVLFVYFDFMIGSGGKYYEGLASISAVLKQQGHAARLFHITDRIDCQEFLSTYERDYADSEIVAFSATSHVFPYVAEFSRALKQKHGEVTTVCGGAHATLFPDDAAREEGLDVICVGEGEYPMAELCTALQNDADISGIRNLWIKRGNEIVKNPVRPLIEDLDSLSPPDRELFDYEGSMDMRMNRVAFMGSRGCPYNCTHCCNHALKKIVPNPGSYVRFKSVDRLIGEIVACLEQHPEARHVDFHDDILNLKPAWFGEFVGKYTRLVGKPYVCCSRFELLKDRALAQFKESGCMQLAVGLESGDEYVRTEVLNRKQSEELIVKSGALCRQYGIKLYVFTMVGIPGETPTRALRTVKLAARLNPTSVQTSIFYPYVGTDLYERCQTDGLLTNKRVDSYFESETVLDLPGFSRKQILFAYQHLRTFVAYYATTADWIWPLNRITQRLIELVWLHPGIYVSIESLLRRLRIQYSRNLKWRFRKLRRENGTTRAAEPSLAGSE